MPTVTGICLERRLESADGFICAVDNCTKQSINSKKYIRLSFKSKFYKKQLKLVFIVYDPEKPVLAANKKPSGREGFAK